MYSLHVFYLISTNTCSFLIKRVGAGFAPSPQCNSGESLDPRITTAKRDRHETDGKRRKRRRKTKQTYERSRACISTRSGRVGRETCTLWSALGRATTTTEMAVARRKLRGTRRLLVRRLHPANPALPGPQALSFELTVGRDGHVSE